MDNSQGYSAMDEMMKGSNNLPEQGFSPRDANPGYDKPDTAEAKIAMMKEVFKGSKSKEERRHIFNEAFRLAKETGMKQFDWTDGTINTELAAHAREATEAAQVNAHVANKAIEHIVNNEGIVHDKTKAEMDMEGIFSGRLGFSGMIK